MSGKGEAGRGTREREDQGPAALRRRLVPVSSAVRRIGDLIPCKKVVASALTVALVVSAVSFTGALTPGRGGEQALAAEPIAAVADWGDSSGLPGQIRPTTQWVNFYGLESKFGKALLPVGAVITAHDPQGVLCGEFSVTQAGRYGLMPVYGDDPSTAVDEGAMPGDAIEFRVNGVRARTTGPDKPVWTAFGDLKQVELVVSKGRTSGPGRKPKK